MKLKTLVIAGLAAAVSMSSAVAAEITGAGATFPFPIYSKWADAYKSKSGVSLNYQSIGSGAGIKQIQSKTVTFGATDTPLKAEELEKYGLLQFPMVMGGIVPIMNVKGIKTGDLVLDGTTLADIYLGKITKWNDEAIVKLNPGKPLPGDSIIVVRRSDGSGTTFNFTTFLSRVSEDWASQVGAANAVEWPVGVGSRGNDGVASNVNITANSIGYVEYAYAKQNNVPYADMINSAGKRVKPTLESFQSGAAGANWTPDNYFYEIVANASGATAWPIVATTFILVYKSPDDKAASAEAMKFFEWAYANGDAMARELVYVPMPDKVKSQVRGVWKTIENK